MGTKAFVFLGLSLAFVLLITSEVAARELSQTSTSNENTEEEQKGVEDAKYGGGNRGGNYGGPGGGYGGPGGGYGGRNGGGGRGHGGGYCGRYGCCKREYYGNGCRRCCSYAGEAVEDTETKPKN